MSGNESFTPRRFITRDIYGYFLEQKKKKKTMIIMD